VLPGDKSIHTGMTAIHHSSFQEATVVRPFPL